MTPTSPQAATWLQLWRLLQQSSASLHKLLAVFPDPASALQASAADWRRAGLAPAKAERLQRWQSGHDPELAREMETQPWADLDWCARPGHGLLCLHDDDYPALLREINDAPPLLFWCGDSTLLALPQIAIVGSRQPSLTGAADARSFAAELSRAGLVVSSGLARGIDAAAHAGALSAQGPTLAVLGTGADRPYPRENQRLYQQILAAGGLIVSEFLPGTPPLALHFPRRNRVLSGLSLGVLVVEAAPESGSLITARLAGEQGRPVWALPGSRHHVQAQGCLKLIREGASAVTDSRQILADLPPLLGFLQTQLTPTPPPAAAPRLHLSAEAEQVLAALGQERRSADWLIAMTALAPPQVLQALSALALAGLISAVPGGYERLPAD